MNFGSIMDSTHKIELEATSMRISARFFVGFGLFILLICHGCGGVNYEAEMKEAQQAMDKAKSLHGEDLAPSNWKEAMQTWEQAQAAAKEGKSSSKTIFLRAKNRFEKTSAIAKSSGDTMAKDIGSMQEAINTRSSKMKAALNGGRLSGKARAQVKALAAEVDEGTAAIDNLMSQGDYLKARATAREVQKKAYDAELIMAGKKPSP
jgi:hypothetical protein